MAEPELFRVKVLLSNYFNDYKKQSYVSVNPQWETVKQFQKHLGSMFGISKCYITTDDYVYLPGKTFNILLFGI